MTDPFSQRRIVLHEKGMDFQIIDVDLDHKPEDLAVMNPYNQVLVLVERDLVLHESNINNEYIDERFPHPFMPADLRAPRAALPASLREGAFVHIDALGGQQPEERREGAASSAMLQITRWSSGSAAPCWARTTWMPTPRSPLLWRLDYYGIQMPKQAAPPGEAPPSGCSRDLRSLRGAHVGGAGDAEVADRGAATAPRTRPRPAARRA